MSLLLVYIAGFHNIAAKKQHCHQCVILDFIVYFRKLFIGMTDSAALS